MSRVSELASLEVAFAAFIVFWVLSQDIQKSALKLLDDERKVKFLDEDPRSYLMYLPSAAAILLMNWYVMVGAVLLVVWTTIALGYEVLGHYRSGMPRRFISRVLLANGVIATAVLLLTIGVVCATT